MKKIPLFFFVLLGGCFLILYAPLVTLLHASIATGDNQHWWFWYWQVLSDEVLLGALNRSLVVATLTGFVATGLGFVASLALLFSKTRLRYILEWTNQLSLVLPELVLALSLLGWFSILHWSLSLQTVLLAHITFCLVFSVFAQIGSLQAIGQQLIEAAQDLGASDWHVLTRIILPNMRSALAASFLLCFILSFDDFLISFYLNGAGSDTLPVVLYSHMRMGMNPKIHALAVMILAFTFLLGLLVSRLKAKSDF